MFQAHFGSEYRGIPVKYAIEPAALGTGGAIRYTLSKFRLHRALVLNADTLFKIDLATLVTAHTSAHADVTVALRRMSDTSRYGTVECDPSGHITTFKAKDGYSSGLINAGIYVIERSTFERFPLPPKFSFESEFLQRHCHELHPFGFVADGYFIDIGVPDDLARARIDLQSA